MHYSEKFQPIKLKPKSSSRWRIIPLSKDLLHVKQVPLALSVQRIHHEQIQFQKRGQPRKRKLWRLCKIFQQVSTGTWILPLLVESRTQPSQLLNLRNQKKLLNRVEHHKGAKLVRNKNPCLRKISKNQNLPTEFHKIRSLSSRKNKADSLRHIVSQALSLVLSRQLYRHHRVVSKSWLQSLQT